MNSRNDILTVFLFIYNTTKRGAFELCFLENLINFYTHNEVLLHKVKILLCTPRGRDKDIASLKPPLETPTRYPFCVNFSVNNY